MVPMVDCKSAEEVRAMALLVREQRKMAHSGPVVVKEQPREVYVNTFKLDYLPRIPLSVLIRHAYPPFYRERHESEIETIRKGVCTYFGVNWVELCSPRRSFDLVTPRQVALALAKKFTTLSLPSIGRIFKRDHTTVLHAARKLKPITDELNVRLGNAPLEVWIIELCKATADLKYRSKNGEARAET